MKHSPFILFSLAAAVFALWAFSGCQHGRGVTCPIDGGVVLRDVKATDVHDPEVVAWTPDRGQVVVTGQRGGKYAVIVANRDPKTEASRWSLASVSIMRSDGSDFWILGDKDYDHRPTRDDIGALLRQLWSEPEKFVFKATAR